MIDTILFDWDGTLIDTAQQAFHAFRKSFADLGLQLDLETYDRIYSPNWYHMYEHLQVARERWDEADELWLRHYEEEEPQLLPGVRSILHQLLESGYALGIVTSGTRARVVREIDALGLDKVFHPIICNEDVAHKKPHPEGLYSALELLNKSADSCCYVGDCPVDIEMGREAKVITVAIPGKYPASRQLAEAWPDYTFASLKEFFNALNAIGPRIDAGTRAR